MFVQEEKIFAGSCGCTSARSTAPSGWRRRPRTPRWRSSRALPRARKAGRGSRLPLSPAAHFGPWGLRTGRFILYLWSSSPQDSLGAGAHRGRGLGEAKSPPERGLLRFQNPSIRACCRGEVPGAGS